jgi:hypothetical protein
MGHLEVINRYTQVGLFEEACVVASAFQEDMTGIFVLLLKQCVRLSLGDYSSLYVISVVSLQVALTWRAV